MGKSLCKLIEKIYNILYNKGNKYELSILAIKRGWFYEKIY